MYCFCASRDDCAAVGAASASARAGAATDRSAIATGEGRPRQQPPAAASTASTASTVHQRIPHPLLPWYCYGALVRHGRMALISVSVVYPRRQPRRQPRPKPRRQRVAIATVARAAAAAVAAGIHDKPEICGDKPQGPLSAVRYTLLLAACP